MKSELLEKIRALIEKGTDSESHVVHLLVLIRKLLDRMEEENIDTSVEYSHLRFHCDWAVHASLDRSKVIQDIFQSLEIIHSSLLQGKKKSDLPIAVGQKIREVTGLDTLRLELELFLDNNNLPPLNTNKTEGWIRFLHFYGLIISACALTLKPKIQVDFLLKEVVVEVQTKELYGEIMHKINWELEDVNGRKTVYFVINSYSDDRLIR